MRWIVVLLVLGCGVLEARVSPLGRVPVWSDLERYQETITREDFLRLLDGVYAPRGAWAGWMSVGEASVSVRTLGGIYELRFARSREEARPVERYWRPQAAMVPPRAGKPMSRVRVAIDPGHIGGKWARMEERWFQIGNERPVTEGDMTLMVARKIAARLMALGAEVVLTRAGGRPLTSLRPGDLVGEARASLRDRKLPVTAFSLKKESERLFYRVAEIRQRARLVNERIQPDLVLCLHFNAEGWGDPERPELVEGSHLHFLITGAWSAEELGYEDQRYEMLDKLLSRAFEEEWAVTGAVADAMARETGLPPYVYTGNHAVNVGGHPYIYARNLLANRLFRCPVVYLEPYVMNSRQDYERIQAGDYRGVRMVGGVPRKSIYREYADGVVAGLVSYYSGR